jgi:hypothetical protein
MRTRKKKKLEQPAPTFTQVFLPGVPSSPFELPYQLPIRKFSEIEDVVGNLRGVSNPCRHLKLETIVNTLDFSLPPQPAPIPPPEEYISTAPYKGYQIPDPVTVIRERSLSGFSSWSFDFFAQSEIKAQEVVPDEYSLINFLLDIIQICEGNITKAEGMIDLGKLAVEKFTQAVKRGDNVWLAWNYAIKPFITDLKAFFNSLNKSKKRLQWLRKVNHKTVPIRFRRGPRTWRGTTTYLPPGFDWEGTIPFQYIPNVYMESNWAAKAVLNATYWVRFDINDAYLQEFGDIIVWMDMSGLYNPYNIIWDAIPFSFVIDWFRTVKNKCETALLSDLSPLGKGEIVAQVCSVKIKYFDYWTGKTGIDLTNRQDLGSQKSSLFLRGPTPFGTDTPFVIPDDWYHISILGALLGQHQRR